jgi:hypothetical protein
MPTTEREAPDVVLTQTIMKPARAAAYLFGGILLAGWLAAAAGVGRPSIPQVPGPSAESVQLDAVAAGVQSQASRLRERLAVAPAPGAAIRNPFAFAARELPPPAVRKTAASPDPAPVADVPPEPDLVLIGMAEDGTTRTAIIGSGEELLMAAEGQTVAGRYRVAKVGPDAVELLDLTNGATRRLFLRLQASLP